MYDKETIRSLNKDIELIRKQRPEAYVYPVTFNMNITKSGVSRLVFLDRYSFKDSELITLKVNDLVILTVKNDPKFPARGTGRVTKIGSDYVDVMVDEEYVPLTKDESDNGVIRRKFNEIDKPLELYYEQTCKRIASGLAYVETETVDRTIQAINFYDELSEMNIIPAGRVLYGAGSGTDVTYFNCYVLPYIHDSREGIQHHRKLAMEIMSRGGGVGTNGSTLRPRNSLAKGVNGKSSGSVSWLNDIANLTNLVEQGGSRRG